MAEAAVLNPPLTTWFGSGPSVWYDHAEEEWEYTAAALSAAGTLPTAAFGSGSRSRPARSAVEE